MKILYVLGFLPTYVKREIEILSQRGHSITVLLPADVGGTGTTALWRKITEDPRSKGVRMIRKMPFSLLVCSMTGLVGPLFRALRRPMGLAKALGEGELRYFLTASETAGDLPGEWKPDVIHSHFAGDQAHIAAILSRILGVPYTVTTHATDIFVPADPARLRRVLHRAAAVLTISEFNRGYLADSGIFSGRTVVVKLAVSAGGLPARRAPRNGPEAVCIASGLVEKKGIEVLLRASELMKKEHPELRFAVIGSDPGGRLLECYRQRASDLPVEFRGALSSGETLEAVAGASFFVLPCVKAKNGDMDGIPVSLMEAMAMSVPVVSTALSGIPELVEHGVTGLLAEPGSPESLAMMMARMLEFPVEAEAMGIHGRDRMMKVHSPDALALTLESVFESAASG